MRTFTKLLALFALGLMIGAASAQQPEQAMFFSGNIGTGASGPQFVAGSYGGNFCSSSSTCSYTVTCPVGHTAVLIGWPFNVTGVTTSFSTTSTNTIHGIYGSNSGSLNPTTAQGTAAAYITCNGTAGSYTATQTGGGNMSLGYFEISGVTAFDTSNACLANAAFIPTCSITTTGPHDFVYWNGLTATGALEFMPAGFTTITLGGFLVADGYQQAGAAGTVTAATTNSGTTANNVQSMLLGFK
jgi:hypothetical protein